MNKIKISDPIKNHKNKVPVSLRTYKDELRYKKIKQERALSKVSKTTLGDEAPLKQWTHWKLIPNAFPYSAAFQTHHLLVPKRVVSETDLSKLERKELDKIIAEVSNLYDCLLMNFTSKQSIRDHFHLHLLTYKDKRSMLGKLV